MECLQETEATCWIRLALVQILFPTPSPPAPPCPQLTPMYTPDLHLPHPGHNPRYIRKAKLCKHYTLFVTDKWTKNLDVCRGPGILLLHVCRFTVPSAHLFWPQQHTWARPLTPKPTYDSIYSNTQVTLLFLRSFLQMEILRKVSKPQNTKCIFSKVCRRQCCQ